MSYDSRLTGRIEIAPPLKWSEYRDAGIPFAEPEKTVETSSRNPAWVILEERHSVQEADTGTRIERAAVAIVPHYDDEVPAYELAEQLEFIAQTFPGREFHGHIIRSGKHQGDVERWWIEDGGPHKETAVLHWPDGTKVDI